MHLRRQLEQALEASDPGQAADRLWRQGHALMNMSRLFAGNGYRGDYQQVFHVLYSQHVETQRLLEAAAWGERLRRADRLVEQARKGPWTAATPAALASVLAECPWHAGAQALLRSAAAPDDDAVAVLRRRFRFRHEGLLRHKAITLPMALACDPVDGSLLVGDRNAGAVLRLDADGRRCGTVLGGLRDPRSLVFDADGSLWVAEMQGERLWRVGRDGRTRRFSLPELLPEGAPALPLSLAPVAGGLLVLLTRQHYTEVAMARLAGPDPLRVVAWQPVDCGMIWSIGAGGGGFLGYFRPVGPVLQSPDGFRWEPFSRVALPAPLRTGRQAEDGVFVLAGDSVVRLDLAGELVWSASLAHLLGRPSSPTDCALGRTSQGRRLYIVDTDLAAIHVLDV